jgi:hypothetical protein
MSTARQKALLAEMERLASGKWVPAQLETVASHLQLKLLR